MGWRRIAVLSPVLFMLALFALFVSPNENVSAQSGGTSTPTPFYCPATSTPTSIIPTPAGLETVVIPTADFGSPVPTSPFATLFVQTQAPTGTPPATVAVTPSPTVPPNDVIFLWGGCDTSYGTCEQITPYYWHFELTSAQFNYATVFWGRNIGFSTSSGGTIYLLFHHLGTSYTIGNSSEATSPAWSSSVGDTNAIMSMTPWLSVPQQTGGNPAGNTGAYAGTGAETWTTLTYTVPAGVSNRQIGFRDVLQFNGIPNIDRVGQEFWVSYQPLNPPATETPPPGDCVVNTSTNITSDIIEWSEPTVSLGECYTIIPEVMLPLPELSWSPFTLPEEIGIPGLFICIDTLSATLKFLTFDVIALMSGIVTVICGVIIYKQINS